MSRSKSAIRAANVPATVANVHNGVNLSADIRYQPSTKAIPASKRFPRSMRSVSPGNQRQLVPCASAGPTVHACELKWAGAAEVARTANRPPRPMPGRRDPATWPPARHALHSMQTHERVSSGNDLHTSALTLGRAIPPVTRRKGTPGRPSLACGGRPFFGGAPRSRRRAGSVVPERTASPGLPLPALCGTSFALPFHRVRHRALER